MLFLDRKINYKGLITASLPPMKELTMFKRKLRNQLIAGCCLFGLSTPSFAFFNPFGMMGSMMGMMAQPVTDVMIGEMLGTMENLMHNNKFRNDVANFMLGTADEAVYELMVSMESQEPTFVGAIAESVMTNGAPRGSTEYAMAMEHWMTVMGPAMQARMEREMEQEAAEAEAVAQENVIDEEISRRNQLNVFVAHGDYNWDTRSYDPDYLAYYENGQMVEYIPTVSLNGDPGYTG